MFPLFETIKLMDGQLMHLNWHQERMERSFKEFYSQPCPHILEKGVSVPAEYNAGIFRCRVLYNEKEISLEFSRHVPAKIKTLRVMHCDTIDYALKYRDRSAISALVDEKGACDDVLIVKKGMITDTSVANILFYDGLKWWTPSTPLLEGTTRNRLIAEGQIHVRAIPLSTLNAYRSFMPINALNDFHQGNARGIDDIIS